MRPHFGPLVLAWPAAGALILFFVVPAVLFLVYSFLTAGLFSATGPLTLAAYREALTSSLNATLARNSAIVGVLAATVSVALALPVSYWLRYTTSRLRMPVLFLITASMFASYLVRIYAWRTVLGTNGILNEVMIRLGIIDQPLSFLLYNRFAVTVALVHIYVPFVVLILFAGFGPLAPALLESAQDLGASSFRRWWTVILPLIAAPITTSFLFVFILSAADYVTPQLIGGTNGVLLGVQVAANFKALGNWPLGAATALVMLVAFLACYGVTQVALRLAKLDKIQWVI